MVDPLNYRNQVKDIFFKNHWEYELSYQYAAETRATLIVRREKRGRRGGSEEHRQGAVRRATTDVPAIL